MRQSAEHSEREVARAIDDILASAEFEGSTSPFEDWLGGLDIDPSGFLAVMKPFLVVFAALAFATALYFFVKWIRGLNTTVERRSERTRQAEDPAIRVRALLQSASEARERGDLRAALRAYTAALIVGLGEGDGLRYHPAWTNRELLEHGEPSEAARHALEQIVHELEPKEFGREHVAEADVNRLVGLCEELLGLAPEVRP